MEEDDTIIIQVIFKFDDGRLYNFDVDRTTTLYETKKILSNAAHILKNSFTLYHKDTEFSTEYDEQPLQKIFPNLRKIEFYLKLKKIEEEQDENENDQISVKYNIKEPCKEHIGKFLVLYCISCKKSICNECFSISHNNHEVEEKADYLMPAKILMERIFSNSFMFKSDPKLSNYMLCVSFRSIIKTDIFDRLRQLINELENKCINCLEFFSFNEDSTEKNNDLNLELLKKYCTSSFIKLKNNIDTKEILINDEVFLSLYNKLKAIKDYEIGLFTENLNKYKTLNQFFFPFTQEIQNMSIDLNNILTRYINKDIYAKFKEEISKNIVEVVQKEDVIRFMFENVNVPKSSLIRPEENYSKNSHTPNVPRLLPSILLMNDARNNNIGNINNEASRTNVTSMNAINLNNNSSNINTNLNQINQVNNSYTQINSVNQIRTQINSSNTNNKINSSSSNSQINSSNAMNQINTLNQMKQINTVNQAKQINSVNQMNQINSVNPMNQINSASLLNQINSINPMNQINSASSLNQINSVNPMNQINSASSLNQSNSVNSRNSVNQVNDINSINKINPVNTHSNIIKYQQVQENFTISGPINYSKINNNPMTNINMNLSKIPALTNQNLANISMMSNINNMNMNNNLQTIQNSNNNASLSNMNNINNIHSMAKISNITTTKVNNITTTSTTEGNSMNKTNTSNSNNVNNMNNNIGSFIYVQNVKETIHETTINKDEKEKNKEKCEKMEVEESNITPPTQNSPNVKPTEINYSKTKIEEIKANLTDKNMYTSPITKKNLISVYLSPSKKDAKSDNNNNKSAIIPNTYIQQKNFVLQNDSKDKIDPNVKSKIESTHTSNIKNSINNVSIFSGKLIDVLNKEKNNNLSEEIKQEKKEESSVGHSPNFASEKTSQQFMSFTSNTTNVNNVNSESINNVNEKYFSKNTENNSQLNYNNGDTSQKNISVAFMYPVYKTNIIKAAVDKNTVQEIKISFSEFTAEDPQINEFPNGGAYCNYENCLYFTGGQEYIKEASKLFLSISKNLLVQNAAKLPKMKFSHWNHSMIADRDKIYVIGGYNSNKCEVYDIKTKTWTEMPDLIVRERQRSMLFLENNFLYCFMGLSQTGILDSIERINIENIEAGWETIIVDNINDVNLKFYGAGIIRMNQVNKIFFIGGKKENKKKETVFKRSIYEFSFDDFKMNVSDFKIENDLIFVENRLFTMDENDCGNFINVGNGYLISMPTLVK